MKTTVVTRSNVKLAGTAVAFLGHLSVVAPFLRQSPSFSCRPNCSREALIMVERSNAGPSIPVGEVPIENSAKAHRFEARFEEGVAVLTYHYDVTGGLVLEHTEVPALLRHHGIATRLAAAALEFARNHQLKVVPVCPFVVAYLGQHPEFSALVRRDRAT